MSKLLQIRQVYYPHDKDAQRQDKIDRLLATLANREFPVQVEVARFQKKRTPEANAYLWGVCYAVMSSESGYEREEIHHAMCCKYFGTKVIEVMGERFERPLRTTTTNEEGDAEWLGRGPFAEFVDFVIREAAMWYGVAIPPPNHEQVPR
jgi:hypothetical protein